MAALEDAMAMAVTQNNGGHHPTHLPDTFAGENGGVTCEYAPTIGRHSRLIPSSPHPGGGTDGRDPPLAIGLGAHLVKQPLCQLIIGRRHDRVRRGALEGGRG